MPKPKGNNKKNVMPVFRIFCEGEKTEPYYIRGYVNNFHSDKRSIIVVENTNKNTPVQLVDVAVESKCGGHEADWIWVVYDRESEAKYSDSLHAEARKKAKDNNINIAFSNVCFEFWLLIHFEYTTAGYTSCDDLLHNSRLREKLSSIGIKDYEKGLPTLFDKLKDKVNDAMKNSEKLVHWDNKILDAMLIQKLYSCIKLGMHGRIQRKINSDVITDKTVNHIF